MCVCVCVCVCVCGGKGKGGEKAEEPECTVEARTN
jgi:hypothetical protein